MPIEFVQPDPVNVTVTQHSAVEDETDVVLRTQAVEVAVPGLQGGKGDPGQWEQVTQAEYDALTTPDPNTLYVVIG